MYCAIRDFNSFNFSGDISRIKEHIIKYHGDLVQALEETEDAEMEFVYDLEGYDITQSLISDLKDLIKARKNVRFLTKNTYADMQGLPHFHPFGWYNAENLDKLHILCEKGVTDVYISGQLAFQMKDARKIADRFGIKLRMVPNISQLSGFTFAHIQKDGNLTAFWVRPEDIELYAEYIDIVEFMCEDSKQEVFHEIYFQEGKWNGVIDTIVAGVNGVNNRGLISSFTETRLNCGKKCLLDMCHSCHRFNIASNLIVENNLEVEES